MGKTRIPDPSKPDGINIEIMLNLSDNFEKSIRKAFISSLVSEPDLF